MMKIKQRFVKEKQILVDKVIHHLPLIMKVKIFLLQIMFIKIIIIFLQEKFKIIIIIFLLI